MSQPGHSRPFLATAALAAIAACHVPADAETPGLAVPLPQGCAERTDLIGLSRVVEIDTTGGPRFGESQYKDSTFLEDGEVVLTFDDGPARRYTLPILDALDAHCTRATFFTVGRMAVADPETLRETARRGHTIAVHTWSHKKLSTISPAKAKDEIELGRSATKKALGANPAPFFRFPYLADTEATLAHLAARNTAVFSLEVDSRDFKTHNPGTVVRTVLSQLQSAKKGIILFHDIQPSTAGALSTLLGALKERGFRVVHIVAKAAVETLAEYDALAEKEMQRRKLALSASSLAERAMNAGQTGGSAGTGETNDPQSGELPWTKQQQTPGSSNAAAKPPAPPRRTLKRLDWRAREDDPWQIRSFGSE
jgi:peptidoglycan/xylan/chitin deacetylase (PgdA/CDA1 family)